MLFSSTTKPKSEQQKVIIVGAGGVGFHIAKRLAEEYKQVVVIDNNIDTIRKIQEYLDVQTIFGSGSSPDILKTAGIENSHIFLALTNSDDTNITATLLAKALSPNIIKLTRIRNEEFTHCPEFIERGALNTTILINPEEEIVRTIERLLTLPGSVEYGEFAHGHTRLVAMRVEQGLLLNQNIHSFKEVIKDDSVMIAAIFRNKKLIIPTGSEQIHYNDLVYFIYKPSSQNALLHALGKTKELLESACILGGGNIGVRLAKLFESKKIHTKLIDINEDRCKELADILKETLVLHGDGTDKVLLEEENIGHLDAFIAVTENDEVNILSSLLAKSLGAKEIVARVNKMAYIPLVEAIGINHSVSPRLSAVNNILHNIRQGGILSTITVGGESADILEILLPKNSALTGLSIKELDLPKAVLLLSIIHEKEHIIPKGETVLKQGDQIILLCLREVMTTVENILTETKNTSNESSTPEP